MSPLIVGVLGILILIIFLAMRIPIAFALSISGIVGIMVMNGYQMGVYTLGTYPFGFLKNWLLVAIPLFILMGNLSSLAGITSKAFEVAYRWLSRLPGGLAVASVVACAGIAATSGSSLATAGMMGAVAIPEMKKYGYSMRLAAGATAAGGLLGILIPPSIMLVLYGSITDTSVGKLLIAGILPGLLTAVIYALGISGMVLRRPELAPPAPRFSWGERFRALPRIWEVVLLFLIVIIGIYMGIFTPTEAAAVGAFVALILALAKAKDRWNGLLTTFSDTARSAVMILAICIGASLFAQFLTLTGIPLWISQAIAGLEIHRFWALLLCLGIYLPLGMFLDTISLVLITMPVLFPVIQSLGYDPIWFGILVIKMSEVALITPPVGLNVYVIKGVAPDIEMNELFRGIVPFLAMEFMIIAILILFPEICLWLPGKMMGN